MSAGILTALAIYGAEHLAAPRAGYMGVSDPEVSRYLLERYLPGILAAQGRILLIYLAAGLVFTYPAVFRPRGRGKKKGVLFLLLFPAVPVISFLAYAVCLRPGLMEESLGRFSLAGRLLGLAASFGPPWLYLVPAASAFILWAVLMAVRKRAVSILILLPPIVLLSVPVFIHFPVGPAPSGTAAANDSPPVIFIGVDSLRSDAISEKSPAGPLLPNLARIRSESVFFPKTFVPLARTFPSLVSLLTSTPPAVHGVRHMFPRLAGSTGGPAALGEVLGWAGYRTGVFADLAGDIFSRMDLGFDERDVPAFNLDTFLQSLGLGRHPFAMALADIPGVRRLLPGLRIKDGFTEPHAVNRRAVRFLARVEGPAFVMLFQSAGHFPYASPYPWYRYLTPPDYRGPHLFRIDGPVYDAAGMPGEEVLQIGRLYRQGMMTADEAVGDFRRRCEEAGIWNRALVVVFSDHGEHLGEDGAGFSHGDHLFGDNAQFTPMLVRFPGGRWAGTEIGTPVSIMDAAPTVLEFIGLPSPEKWEGLGILSYLERGKPLPERVLSGETGLWFDPSIKPPHQAGRMIYPAVTSLLEADDRGELVLKEDWEEAVMTAKHRCILAGEEKLVYAPAGGRAGYYLEDKAAGGGPPVDGSGSPLVETFRAAMAKEGLVMAGRFFVPARGVER